MKKITLIRHAKVKMDNKTKIDATALPKWIYDYDHAFLDEESLAPKETIKAVENADFVLTSKLQRTIDTAYLLGLEINEQNELFDEATVPTINIPFLKFRPVTWLTLIRIFLLFELTKKRSRIKESRDDAKKATEHLVTLTSKYDNIVVVGHAGKNWLIRKELLKMGCRLEVKPSNRNWGVTVLTNSSEIPINS